MRVYIAGPMSGLPDFNYPAFFDAADRLRAFGHDPINPARAEGREGCTTWLDFMRASLRDIADADGIAVLSGWQSSRGSLVECRIGLNLRLPVETLGWWLTSLSLSREPLPEGAAERLTEVLDHAEATLVGEQS